LCPWTGFESAPPVRRRTSSASLTAVRESLHRLVARSLGIAFCFALVAALSAPAVARAENTWAPLTRRLVADGFDAAAMEALFARPELRFDPQIMARKMNVLLEIKLSAGQPKAEEPELYWGYLNPVLLYQARSFLQEQRATLREVRSRYDVPGEILVALLLVETKLGRNVGSRSALVTLASMALAGDFSLVEPYIEQKELEPKMAQWLRQRTAQKGAWAYRELKALLAYAKSGKLDPLSIPGSVYGAIGLCQFMPTNALRYGLDMDGDGRVDLFSPSDALLSIACFLKANGWAANLSRQQQMTVLYRYNHSLPYTRTILAVADRLREPD